MAVKELIFANKKWWPGNQPNIIGKTIVLSKSIAGKTIKAGNVQPSQETFHAGKITGMFLVNAKNYVSTGQEDGRARRTLWLDLDTIFENGGVSSNPVNRLDDMEVAA